MKRIILASFVAGLLVATAILAFELIEDVPESSEVEREGRLRATRDRIRARVEAVRHHGDN